MELGLEELIELLKPKRISLDRDIRIKGVSIDSRSIESGEIFVAIKGVRYDGHDFACEASKRAGTFAIVEKPVDCPHLLVDNTLGALKRLAEYNLKKSGAFSVAVVGSLGKTTTKELLSGFLSCSGRVYKSFANENNVIGVCKTLLNLKNQDFCVVEVGVSKPGEMDEIVSFFKPNGVLFLNVGSVHLEYFGSVERVFEEKAKIIQKGSVLVFNGDDGILREAFRKRENSFCYSRDVNCDFKVDFNNEYLIIRGEGLNVKLKSREDVNPENVVAAVSGASVFGGIKKEECFYQKIGSFKPLGFRMKSVSLGKTRVILDCYNANVHSMKYAIGVLSKYEGKKLAVLGDMFELGKFSEGLHREVGRFLKGRGIELCAIGKDARFIYEEAKNGVNSWYFSNRDEAIEFLKSKMFEYDVVLFKASRGMKLEEIFEAVRR